MSTDIFDDDDRLACGCEIIHTRPGGDFHAITFCDLHAAAPRLAEHLVMLSGAAEAYMRYHAEKFYAESDAKPTGLWPQIEAARVLVAETGP